MQTYFDFEKPIAELEQKIKELQRLSTEGDDGELQDSITKLQSKVDEQLIKIYKNLDAWEKTQIARHPDRPHFIDYINDIVSDFTPLAGDRLYGEDYAIIAGLGRWMGVPVAILGHEKGSTTEARIKHNFGMARPEGYRKAIRLMEIADRFNLPLISLVDTAGAYPGIGAEERGQAEAIARCTDKCLQLRVPFISLVIGEGGSGGALALATANRILMLEHSIYTVASPEAAASILWRSSEHAETAAKALKISAQSLLEFGVIDRIIPESIGGAHRNRNYMIEQVNHIIMEEIRSLQGISRDELKTQRQEKFLAMGRKGLA